jgi:hypothetical protein
MLKSAWKFWGTVSCQVIVAAKQVSEPFLLSTKMFDTPNIILVEALENEGNVYGMFYICGEHIHMHKLKSWSGYVIVLTFIPTQILHRWWHTNPYPHKTNFCKHFNILCLSLIPLLSFLMFLQFLKLNQHCCISIFFIVNRLQTPVLQIIEELNFHIYFCCP